MRHPHADLMARWVENTTQVVEFFYDGEWLYTSCPTWDPDYEYRIRHKHQDLIDQKAARPELIVEMWLPMSDTWLEVNNPLWKEEVKYRLVEPEPEKPKTVEMWQWVVRGKLSGHIWKTDRFYQCVEDLQKVWDHENYDVIQRADWTRIEVPV